MFSECLNGARSNDLAESGVSSNIEPSGMTVLWGITPPPLGSLKKQFVLVQLERTRNA